MKLIWRRNWKYLVIALVSLLIMLYGMLEDINFFKIIFRAMTDPVFRANFFLNQELDVYRHFEPTLFNIAQHVIETSMGSGFDAIIVLSTVWFQLIIPLFALPVCVSFYKMYHSVLKFSYHRSQKSYRKILFREIFWHAFKLAASVFAGYLIFMVIAKSRANPGIFGDPGRSLFKDLIGNGLYTNHTVLYFVLEGFVRFFMVPFFYTCLGQAAVLSEVSLRYVIGTPIIYYYGLAAIGYALYLAVPSIAIYINPTVLMANGSYDFNTLLMLLTNLMPLYLSIGIIYWKDKHVEI